MEKTSAGSKITLGDAVEGHIEPNRWYEIKIEVAGGRIKCYLDGALIHNLAVPAAAGPAKFAASCVKDTATGDVILKLVNLTAETVPSQINLSGIEQINPAAEGVVLTGDPREVNSFARPSSILPRSEKVAVGKSFPYSAPPHSLSVIRMKTK